MKKKMIIKEQRGAAVVEFAIVLPILVLAALIIIEGGLLFYNKHIITNASREGARAGIARTTMEDPGNPGEQILVPISDIVYAYCKNFLISKSDTSPVTIVLPSEPISVDDTSFPFNADLTVQVSYKYNLFAPKILGFESGIPISAQTTMKMQ